MSLVPQVLVMSASQWVQIVRQFLSVCKWSLNPQHPVMQPTGLLPGVSAKTSTIEIPIAITQFLGGLFCLLAGWSCLTSALANYKRIQALDKSWKKVYKQVGRHTRLT
jgi:hypothetical protein